MVGEAECARRLDGKARQAEKERFFSDRIQPNILLTGWTTWWSRMEAEKRKEEKFIMNKVDSTRSRAYSNIKKETFIKRFFLTTCSTSRLIEPNSQMEKYAAEVELKCGQSPKRKNDLDNISQGSPAKIRKVNRTFSQNFNYWKTMENTQVVPTASNLRTETKTKTGIVSHTRLTKLEVVTQPGR